MYRLLLAVAASALAASPAIAQIGTPNVARRAFLEPCSIPLVGAALCGIVPVPEDPNDRRTINLNIVVVPASGDRPHADPIFFLAGGPGQAATELAGPMSRVLTQAGAQRDIVFVDQRGTGESNPLQCAVTDPVERFHLGLELRMSTDRLRNCLRSLEASLEWYATPTAMDDLDRVREALDYEQINLYGGSYGTRAALVYMRRHPERVRTAVLAGVAPTPVKLPVTFARDAEDALAYVQRECHTQPRCLAKYPFLIDEVHRTLERLEREPGTAIVRDTVTGRNTTMRVTRDLFAAGVLLMLYGGPFTPQLPRVVYRAKRGDFDPFVRVLQPIVDQLAVQLYAGMTLTVICAEDAPFIDLPAARRAADGTFLRNSLNTTVLDACKGWPRAPLPNDYSEHVRSDIPTLMLSGAADPVTPPRHAEEAGRFLTNHLHVRIPNAGHLDILSACEVGLVTEFYEAGSVENLDTSCVARRPPRRFAGTRPR